MKKYRIMVIQPGASTSVSDVYTGLVGGLKELGHEIIYYQLDTRIARAGAWLNFCWEEAKKKNPDVVEPTTADILFQACGMSIPIALLKKPDWVIVVSSMYYPKLFLKMLKQAGMNLALLLTESPYDDEEQYSLAAVADVVWTNERTSLDNICLANPNTHYLPHAYDPARHCPSNGNPWPSVPADGQKYFRDGIPAHDVVFVGTGFKERIETLERVNWDGIDLGLYGTWELLGWNSKLKKHIRDEEISNDMAAALYRKAKIGLNLHRTSKGFGSHGPKITKAESLNPRAYELAACGCFYISDDRMEVRELFGEHVPTFSTPSHLERQIRFWLEKDEERRMIAEQLPAKVSGHTWLERAGQVVENLTQGG
jgi:spore maturation protein CgeB